MKQQERIGAGTAAGLRDVLSILSSQRVFLVTGRNSYDASGARDLIEPQLKGHDRVRFSDFATNPQIGDIERGVRALRETRCDAVVAVGGGSVIDVAKAVNLLAAQPSDPRAYVLKQKAIAGDAGPLVAIPTTGGSGSEATCFAVVYLDRVKYSLEHESMLADFAIVDPQLTMSAPPHLTAVTGMDALCQAVESYWSVRSTGVSRGYAAEALRLALQNLEEAVNSPSTPARDAMARAAHLAGKAINISRTSACHAVSYPMTSHFGVPHGQAVALTLPSMLLFNSGVTETDLLDSRGLAFVRGILDDLVSMIGAASFEEAAGEITRSMKSIGLQTTLGGLGIDDDGISVIVENGFNPERVSNNPRILTQVALRSMLTQLA